MEERLVTIDIAAAVADHCKAERSTLIGELKNCNT